MKNLAIILAFVCIPLMGMGQHFVPRTVSYSKKKTAYIFKTDGTKITCLVTGFTWKKGNIAAIKVEDMDGKAIKLTPAEISHMYLPPSSLNKLVTMFDFLDDPSQWGDTDLDKALLGEKLAYFEQTKVKIKKKEFNLMMQIVNPTYCTKMRVYGDPLAEESMTGEEKSYYIKKNGEAFARVIERSNYKEEFKLIFSDCPAVLEKYGNDVKWNEFELHVWEYAQACK